MVKRGIFVSLLMLTIASLACSTAARVVSTVTPIPTGTQASSPTSNLPPTEPPQQTETARALVTSQADATISANQTLIVKNSIDLKTQKAATKLTATEKIILTATARVKPFMDTLQRLKESGVIYQTEGGYVRLDDFDQSWAQIDWFRWWNTDYSPENFVISANAKWSSASDKSNWPGAGCGFVFAFVDKQNYRRAYLGLDGNVRLSRKVNNTWNTMARQKTDGVTIPNGDAKIMLVVFDKRISFYVNDVLIASALDTTQKPGVLAFTLASGTNKDYGTRCQMTNVNLWIIK
jgi:hypothetical protein